MPEWELTLDEMADALNRPKDRIYLVPSNIIAKAAQRKLVEKQERMFNRLISAQSRKDLLESPEWQELRKGVGLE